MTVPGPACFNLKFSSLNDFPNIDFPPVPLWLVKSPPCDGQAQPRFGSKFQLSAYTLCVRETHLTHELRYDPVEHGALVAKAILPGAQCSKVCCKLG